MGEIGNQFEELVKIVSKLRSPDGCPWDREQTNHSLLPYFIEEVYEVIESIDLEWVDAVGTCSDLAPTDNQPLFEGANEVQTQYHSQFAPNVQDWWRAVRGS